MNTPHPRLTDLGYINAGGETEKRIMFSMKTCLNQGHHPIETNEGTYGTNHAVKCEACAYIYHYDSSG